MARRPTVADHYAGDPSPVLPAGAQGPGRAAVAAMDRLAALADEGDPLTAKWWRQVQSAGEELAGYARRTAEALEGKPPSTRRGR